MKLGLVQMPVTKCKEQNLAYAEQAVAQCAQQGAELVVLPEMFLCPYANDAFPVYAEEAGGESWLRLSAAAKDNALYLIGGSIPERDGRHLYNTSFAFGPDGGLLARHRKAHLFDIDVPGGQCFRESFVFSRGDSITLFEAAGVKMGLCICFDMRFPELSRIMALRGAQLIVVPAAFNMTTGPAHWELLFRQRAVDNQLYTVGVAPARDVSGPYVSYGNSIVASPWGDVVFRADEQPVITVVEIDLQKNRDVRQQLPLLNGRRADMYALDTAK